MRYINFRTVGITIVLLVLFSYQPPMIGNARIVSNAHLNLIKIDTVKFALDTTLMDSLLSLKTKFEVSKIESEVLLDEIDHQHQLLELLNKK